MRGIRRVFWDIETAPNVGFFWRSGHKQFISHENIITERAVICICYKYQGSKEVKHLVWDDGCDRSLLEKWLVISRDADELVAHNGDKFDLKWINTRMVFHGLDPKPIEGTVDTLAIARRRFLFNSNKLDYIAKFLGLGGKAETGGFDLWKSIILNKDKAALLKMVRYCRQDVRLLEQVFEKLQAYHNPKIHLGVLAGLEKWSCPHCASENVHRDKKRVTSMGSVRHSMECLDCKKFYTISDSSYLESLRT